MQQAKCLPKGDTLVQRTLSSSGLFKKPTSVPASQNRIHKAVLVPKPNTNFQNRKTSGTSHQLTLAKALAAAEMTIVSRPSCHKERMNVQLSCLGLRAQGFKVKGLQVSSLA